MGNNIPLEKSESSILKLKDLKNYFFGMILGIFLSIFTQLLLKPFDYKVIGIVGNQTIVNITYGSESIQTTNITFLISISLILGFIAWLGWNELKKHHDIPDKEQCIITHNKSPSDTLRILKKILKDIIDMLGYTESPSGDERKVISEKIDNGFLLYFDGDEKDNCISFEIKPKFIIVKWVVAEDSINIIKELNKDLDKLLR